MATRRCHQEAISILCAQQGSTLNTTSSLGPVSAEKTRSVSSPRVLLLFLAVAALAHLRLLLGCQKCSTWLNFSQNRTASFVPGETRTNCKGTRQPNIHQIVRHPIHVVLSLGRGPTGAMRTNRQAETGHNWMLAEKRDEENRTVAETSNLGL